MKSLTAVSNGLRTVGLPIVRKPGVWSNPWYRFPGDLDVAPRMAAVSNGLRVP